MDFECRVVLTVGDGGWNCLDLWWRAKDFDNVSRSFGDRIVEKNKALSAIMDSLPQRWSAKPHLTVWEGSVDVDYGDVYSHDPERVTVKGQFRAPTPREWSAIKRDKYPWPEKPTKAARGK